MWVENDKGWICIFPGDYFGNDDFVSIDHCINHRSKCSLILRSFYWQNHINPCHKMAPGNTRLVCEPQQLKLLLNAFLLHFNIFIIYLATIA
jgi:hypothetical protein